MRVLARLLTPAWLSSVLLGLVVATTAVLPASASASPTAWPAAGHVYVTPTAWPAAGHVYVNDNTAGANTIAGFARAADGSLTPLPGSPFSAGGAGLGKGLGSQGAIQITANGRYLLAVDAGSNQISVLRIERNGSLEVVGSPVSSGGIKPVSIAIHKHLVYVANTGNGVTGANYTGFTLHRGVLTPLAGSTLALSPTAGPDDVLFNGDGTKLVGNEVTPSLIDSFAVAHNGRLTAAPGSPFTAQGLGPFGSEFRPTNPNQLFVTNAHNGTGLGTVSAFNDSANGTLSSIGSSPFADFQTAPCWLVISHDGQYLFAVNTASGTISRFWVAPRGALTLLGSTNVAAGGGVGGTDPGLSADGRYLYVDESGIDSLGEFSVKRGNLSELASSPVTLPVGATPAGIVVS